jgi:hypothetical protein
VSLNCLTSNAVHQASKHFTYTVEYAAKADQPLEASSFSVLWNNQEFDEIFPTDYERHTVSYEVDAIVGENIVNIDGTGNHDTYGVGIGKVTLVREGGDNIVVNGKFSQDGQTGVFANGKVAGWVENAGTGNIEIVSGASHNPLWGSGDFIAELNAEATSDIYQSICLDADYNVVPCDPKDPPEPVSHDSAHHHPHPAPAPVEPVSHDSGHHEHKPAPAPVEASCSYTLSVDNAARAGVGFNSNSFAVWWDGVKIADVNPTDYNIHNFHWTVSGHTGDHTVQFQGTGVSDSLGAGITNVKLVDQSGTNHIVNGNFDQGPIHSGWGNFHTITGWTGNQYNIEIGQGSIYNPRWGGRWISELDTNANTIITQTVSLTCESSGHHDVDPTPEPPAPKPVQHTLTLSVDNANRNGVAAASNSWAVWWDGVKIADVAPRDYNIHNYHWTVHGGAGTHTVQFQGTGTSDSLGAGITNVKLVDETGKNYIVNGNFDQGPIHRGWGNFHTIPGWVGNQFNIEIGQGNIYNPRWGGRWISELDTNANTIITQTVTL